MSGAGDDFKLITGIGPAIERRLHDGGIRTFAQLAASSSPKIAVLVADVKGLSAERIAQQDWIGQARELALEPVPAKFHHSAAPPGNRQHYATFTVELLLDEDNNVRRTRVQHIQSGDDEPKTWAGWDARRMVEFIVQHAALRLPAAKPTPAVTATSAPAPPPVTPVSGSGIPRLHDLETWLPDDAAGTRSILRHDQPFSVRLTLDLTEVAAPSHAPFDYTAAVYAKDLRGGPRRTVGEAYGTIIMSEDPLTIAIKGRPLPRGIYRLEAVATLTLPSAEADIAAHLEGSLLQIY
jgi:hypothetical protein